jgi:hypothetical protein
LFVDNADLNGFGEFNDFFPHAPLTQAYHKGHMWLDSWTRILVENAITSSIFLPFNIVSDLLKLSNSSDTALSDASKMKDFSSACLDTWFAAGFQFFKAKFLIIPLVNSSNDSLIVTLPLIRVNDHYFYLSAFLVTY